MKLIDFAKSYCIFRVQMLEANTFRQRVICKADFYVDNKFRESIYLQHGCGGELVYEKNIFYNSQGGFVPFIFTTITSEDLVKLIRIYIPAPGVEKECVDRAKDGQGQKTHRIDGKIYKWMSNEIELAEYEEINTTDDIIDAVLLCKEMVGTTEYAWDNGLYRWVITYPIDYINVDSDKKLYQVDAGEVLFTEEGNDLEKVFMSYVAYSNAKEETEFFIYYDNRPGHYYFDTVKEVNAINKLYVKKSLAGATAFLPGIY